MRTPLQKAGVRRLYVAAGLSVALHATIAVSVHRGLAGGAPPLPAATAPPLIARLVSTVSDAVMPAAVPEVAAIPGETAALARPAITSSPDNPENNPSVTAGSVHYFKTSELDRRPFPLSRIEIPSPESTATEAGSVMIRLRISESGRVEDAKIVMGTGFAEFEAAALREFSRAKFHPGYRGNLPVRSEMLIEVTLRPPGSDHKSRLPPAQATTTNN